MMKEYIVTIREASRDSADSVVAGQAGVDILLETTMTGHLKFDHDVFLEAAKLLEETREV